MSTVDNKTGCMFCEKLADDSDRENLILHRGENCFVILNLYPYSTGHIMVAPNSHVSTIENLDDKTLMEMMNMSQRCMGALREQFNPDGFNLGLNIERVAGAGITEHVHLHVVPRWSGDSNFMPVCADTRILPLSLDEVWEKLNESL